MLSQLSRTMEALAILRDTDREWVKEKANILKNAYDPEIQKASKHLTEKELEELLFTM